MRPCLLLTFLLVPLADIRGDDEAIRAEIFENWRARQTAVDTLYCLVESKRLISKGLYSDLDLVPKEPPMPAEDEWIEQTYRLWVDFEKSKCRLEHEGLVFQSDKRGHFPFHRVTLFDGETPQEYRPAALNSDPGVAQVELQERTADGQFLKLVFEPLLLP
ncbi:MAG: hypothetical protein KF861_13110, partial [Planctomycetaceae bacterium]|nr:hypothetical protein [Planctomycetaceae bacterium]